MPLPYLQSGEVLMRYGDYKRRRGHRYSVVFGAVGNNVSHSSSTLHRVCTFDTVYCFRYAVYH